MKTNPRKRHMLILGLMAILVGMVLYYRPSAGPQQVGSMDSSTPANPSAQRLREHLAHSKLNSTQVADDSEQLMTGDLATLTPKPMSLVRKVLVNKPWNSDKEAFGRSGGQEQAFIGPSATAYNKGNIYVLDNVNGRLLGYDKAGHQISSVAVPTDGASDLIVDSSDSSLLLVDHRHNQIYKVADDQVSLLGSSELRANYPFGTKFAYDAASGSLVVQDVDQSDLAELEGDNLILKNGEKPLAIKFDRPVQCVEEVATDAKGITWVLYTLVGDYQMRRLARVDPVRGTVGVAELDVWFAFDATRHMTLTDTGVVVLAGDQEEGRLLAFDYAGGGR